MSQKRELHRVLAQKIYPHDAYVVAGMCATRFTSAFLVLFMGGFTIREQLFMSMSWVPKVRTCCWMARAQSVVIIGGPLIWLPLHSSQSYLLVRCD